MINNEQYSIILPARIIKYYPENQTADILVSAERVTHTSSKSNNSTSRSAILGVPVHTPSGGGWAITFPVKVGDTCVMLFSQIGYDHWLYENKDKAGTYLGLPKPHLSRQFNEDDGFAFVGMNSLPQAVPDYHATHSQWRGPNSSLQVISLNDDKTISIISDTKVTVTTPQVEVNCTDAVVNASTSVKLDTPDTHITGTLTVDGAVTNKSTMDVTGAVTHGATVGTTGVTTTGGIAVAGGAAADMGSGAMSSTGTMSVNGVDLETHVHAGDGGTGSGADTGPPL